MSDILAQILTHGLGKLETQAPLVHQRILVWYMQFNILLRVLFYTHRVADTGHTDRSKCFL